MRTLIITICLLCLTTFVQAEPNDVNVPAIRNAATIRALFQPADNKTTGELWLGFQRDNSEAGLIGGYAAQKNEEIDRLDSSYSFGIFGMYHFSDIRADVDNIFWPMEYLPDSIKAEPAVGVKFKYNFDDKSFDTAFILALRILDNIELQYILPNLTGNADTSQNPYVGISWVWKF